MFNVRNLLVLLLVLISTPVLAFMPAAGMWGIDSENNGLPGRGFQIEAENEIIVFTYFGYREDGSGTFHYASGPIVNNTFTSPLLNIQGGTTMGGAQQNAVVAGSPGNVTINFTSGKHGFIALPGEPQKAISKRPFGYTDGPDGLLGTWLLTQKIGTFHWTDQRTLSVKTGDNTTTGNGTVTTASVDLVCEFQVSGDLAGMVVCVDLPIVTNSDTYMFKFAGDKGTGMAMYKRASGQWTTPEEAHVFRTATKNGTQTGIADANVTSLMQHSQVAPDQTSKSAMPSLHSEKSISIEEAAKAEALKNWTLEVLAVMQGT